MKRKLLLLVVFGGAFVLWKTGAFGAFPVEREVIVRLPVSYLELRRLELQIWDGDSLLKREEQAFPSGLTHEPSFRVPLAMGAHRAIASVSLATTGVARAFSATFDPQRDETVVVDFSSPRATQEQPLLKKE